MFQNVRNILACALLAVMTAAGVYGTLFIRATTAVVAALPAQIQDTRVALTEEATETRRELIGQVDAIRKDASSQLTALQSNVFSQVSETREVLDRRVGDSLGRVDTALAKVDQLRGDVHPILENVQSITHHADSAAELAPELTRNALGAVAAFKVTIGQGAKTMIAVENATPAFLRTMQKVGDNSDAATAKTVATAEESRRLLHNLAENTTPLPKFIRYPAQVIGLMGSAAVPVITIQKLESVK